MNKQMNGNLKMNIALHYEKGMQHRKRDVNLQPMSSFWNFRIVSVIRVSYSDSDVSCTLYLGDETIISPVDRSPLSEMNRKTQREWELEHECGGGWMGGCWCSKINNV